jgi:hypothetical protein
MPIILLQMLMKKVLFNVWIYIEILFKEKIIELKNKDLLFNKYLKFNLKNCKLNFKSLEPQLMIFLELNNLKIKYLKKIITLFPEILLV